jgi:hypothetical protein
MLFFGLVRRLELRASTLLLEGTYGGVSHFHLHYTADSDLDFLIEHGINSLEAFRFGYYFDSIELHGGLLGMDI